MAFERGLYLWYGMQRGTKKMQILFYSCLIQKTTRKIERWEKKKIIQNVIHDEICKKYNPAHHFAMEFSIQYLEVKQQKKKKRKKKR